MVDSKAISERVAQSLIGLAYRISLHFPHHGLALKEELEGRNLTNERWNRTAAILASLRALPGIALTNPEHKTRNIALGAIEIPRQMAVATFNIQNDDDSYFEQADLWAKELEGELLK